jgi:AcrR family transcriptional regulator
MRLQANRLGGAQNGQTIMDARESTVTEGRSFVVSMDNRKARGQGHERPAEILEAARALFLEHGVEQVTTRQIAARVGISQTALYVYFKTKEVILDRLAERAWCGLVKALDALVLREGAVCRPSETLRATLVTFMRFWLEHPDDYRIVFLRKALNPSAEDEIMLAPGKTLLLRLTGRVEEAVKAGSVRCLGSNQATALSIWAAVSGMVALRLRFPEFPWPPVNAHIEAMADLIMNGCASRVTPTSAPCGSHESR